MDVDQSRQETPPMTFDEVSMERGKKFVKALQELKNLRPQLYSAAEYCDKSYLHSEQMQMVLDNLKGYVIRALVNAVDHLGTVASKLTDLLEQYSLDINAMDLKITCLNQQLVTCQVYTDKGGLRQQQLLAIIPTHHKYYILPNTTNKKVHFSPHILQTDPSQHIQERPRLFPSGASAVKALLWHLASETKSTLKGSPHGSMSTEDTKTSGRTFGPFNLLEAEESARMKSTPTSSFAIQTRGVAWLGSPEGSKLLTSFRSFDSPTTQRETVQTPVRSKSMLSAIFVKQKTQKRKTGA